MKVIAFNGSPRKKNWNTVTLLKYFLKGVETVGAKTRLIHLYDLNYSGCVSCFACKRKDRKNDGVCALKDDLSSVLERVKETDVFAIGSPVYYGAESAATRALLERLCFPYNKYSKDKKSLFPKKIKTALIYTMNVGEDAIKALGYDQHFNITKMSLEKTFGNCEILFATDTLQYSDYDKYEHEMFNKEDKIKRHKTVFPHVCEVAFNLGKRLSEKNIG
jgi:multimeric flavodoxin WrbA